ncbi:DNA-damage-inducible protein d [uncultured Candidatus Thioglobus sp.]|nr:DNA-damage-inducible protein d [uncultured Candidatus Thioglobus sp.]
MMNKENKLIVFDNQNIRRTWFDEQWWFVAVDIVAVLTDSKNPSGYLKDILRRDENFSKGWGQIATPLKIQTKGGKRKA